MCICVWSSLLEIWIPTLITHISQTLILVEWPSHKRYVVVIISFLKTSKPSRCIEFFFFFFFLGNQTSSLGLHWKTKINEFSYFKQFFENNFQKIGAEPEHKFFLWDSQFYVFSILITKNLQPTKEL